MGSSSLRLKQGEKASSENPTSIQLYTLLFQLVDLAEILCDEPKKNSSGKKVLLDVTLDGHRYTLISSQLAPPKVTVKLSPRELEIVRLVAKGHPNKTIAAILDISPWTVATHLRRAFDKLGVKSRAEVVARAFKESLLEDV